ncbi:MAG: hypothetical protein J5580_02375 [Clostridia bacterium]|nr:hypothetical protein [Clostridia bacterium]
MKLKIFKQIAFMLVAGVVGLGIGLAIMWNGHNASAASNADYESNMTGDNYQLATCQHELEHIAEVSPTCGQAGVRDHYTCKKCHKNFSANLYEYTADELRLDNSQIAHTLEHCAAQEPTCTAEGWHEHWHCQVCGQNFHDEKGEDTFKNVKLASHHDIEKVDASVADCEHAGHIAYYQCKDCNKKFSDENGKNELTDDKIIIKAEHTIQNRTPEEPRTCTKDGHPAYYECIVCHKKFLDLDCEIEFDANNLPADYRHQGHQFGDEYVSDGTAYQTYFDDTHADLNQKVKCNHYCMVCGEVEDCEGHPLSAFASLTINHGVSVTYVSQTELVDGKTVVDYTIFTIENLNEQNNAVIKITLPEIYSARSVCTYNGETLNFAEFDSYYPLQKVISLPVNFDDPGEKVLYFNFDGAGKITQTIKIVKA